MKIDPVALLQDLIRIPSVNPDGDPGIAEASEARLAEFLREFLQTAGAEAELREVLPGRPNVIARFPTNRAGKPRMLLAPHTDTVSVVGMTIEPFSGELREGRIWGRGASDTKGPMAAMLAALVELGREIADLDWEIWFAGLMGEEAGLHGSRALANEEHFDFVIVGEPTEMRAVHAHKGAAWLKVVASGRSAHASTPEAGVNAIDALLAALAEFRARFEETRVRHQDPTLGFSTLNLSVIHGGSKVNIVPSRCEALVDMRVVPGFPVEELVKGLQTSHPGFEVTLHSSPPLFTATTHPMFRTLEAAGIPPTTAPWFCDAAPFSEKGIAAIALGPGSIAQAHIADESIAVDALCDGAVQLTRFLRSLAS